MSDISQPPPRDIDEFDTVWKDWLWYLYRQVQDMSSEDPWIEHAKQVIFADYGVSVSLEAKNKDLLKFGLNELVGTTEATVMTLPAGQLHETYVSSNLINSIISDSAADGETVTVEGHTLSGSDFTFVTQDITLNGTTKVALTTALARVSRVFNISSTDLTGSVYVTETDTYTAGVPDTDTKVHLTVAAGSNQSEKAATTTSSTDYFVVSRIYGDYLKKQAGFSQINFEIRLSGKVFRHRITISCNSGSRGEHEFIPYLIIPPNADIRLVAIAGGASTPVSGGIQGAFLKA